MDQASVPAMQITVSDPVKHSEGINAYVTYKVTTRTTLERFDSPLFYVHRRYSDFEWIHEQLSLAFPGIIIPPLPEKHVMRRFSEPFLSQRQRALEKFLNRIAAHEQLREHMYLKSFLEMESLESLKTTVAKQTKGTATGSFWQMVSDATNSLSNKVVGNYKYNRPRTDEDIQFDHAKQYINSLDPQISALSKHTHTLVMQEKQMAQALFDFGLAFTLLGQAESDSLGDAMAQLGQCADKLSRITAVEADKEAQYFDEPMAEYVKIVRQVKLALEARQNKATAYESLMGELDAKKEQKNRIQMQSVGASDAHSHQERLRAAEADIVRVERELENARQEFELVTSRVLSEISRFKKEKLHDFKQMILDYVQLQIEYNQQVEQSWRDVLPALQSLNIQNKNSGDELEDTTLEPVSSRESPVPPSHSAAEASPTSPPAPPSGLRDAFADEAHDSTGDRRQSADEEEAFV